MEPYSVTLNDETVSLSWRMGKIHSDGYDLEDEKAVLALNNNLGEGIGALLVAIDELEVQPPLEDLFKGFLEELTKISVNQSGMVGAWTDCTVLYNYLSFSPQVSHRIRAIAVGKFTDKILKRIVKDKEEGVHWYLARYDHLPLEVC